MNIPQEALDKIEYISNRMWFVRRCNKNTAVSIARIVGEMKRRNWLFFSKDAVMRNLNLLDSIITQINNM